MLDALAARHRLPRVLAAVAAPADATGVNGTVGDEFIDVRDLAGAEASACATCTGSRPAG